MMEEEDTILFTAPATPRQRTASQLAALRAQVAELRQRLAASPSALLDDTDSEDSDARGLWSVRKTFVARCRLLTARDETEIPCFIFFFR